jgi:c(7)-type cytochrome triheme protein
VAARRADGRAVVVAAVLSLLPVMALAIPASLRIPRAPEARPFAPPAWAVFSHTGHEPLRCYQCHPSVFPQAQVAFTHADMDQGRFCGSCHQSRRAPAVASYPCESCHVPAK